MSHFLEEALRQLAKLPPAEQETVGAILLEELASERRWTESFTVSQDVLATLAEDALTEDEAGLTEPL